MVQRRDMHGYRQLFFRIVQASNNRNGERKMSEIEANVSTVNGSASTTVPVPSPTHNQNPPDNFEGDLDRITPAYIRERIFEDDRRAKSMRGILLETINILYREYNVRGLKYFRLRVEDAETVDELKVASDMLTTLGRFHEVAGNDEQGRE